MNRSRRHVRSFAKVADVEVRHAASYNSQPFNCQIWAS
jgi:hypothetical protein